MEVTPSDESSMKVIPVIFTISREHADWKVAIGIDGSSAVTISQWKSTQNGGPQVQPWPGPYKGVVDVWP